MELKVENIILENLIHNDNYFRKVFPHLKEEYFSTKIEKTIFKFITIFSEKHNKAPNQKILGLLSKEYPSFTQEEYIQAELFVRDLNGKEENVDWLTERTEKFCKDKAFYNAVMTTIQAMDGNDPKLSIDAMPSLMQDALAVSFDNSVGHDFFDDVESRFDFYHLKEDRIPFKLSYFNKVTKNGVPRKTLNAVLAGVNVGKSLFLCDMAASSLSQGYNVLYITMEMAQERIAERIDCNMLDIDIDALGRLDKDDFVGGVNGIKAKTHGKLIIKEYPTGAAHVGHFRALLEELKLKKNFLPDVICIDYINICASLKYKSSNYNSYFAVKSIAEELRGLMVEYNCVGWTATQLTRSGFSDSDFDMTSISESFGLAATLDCLFGIIRTEELDKMNQLMIKQLKSRYNDVNYFNKFLIGIDIRKFKLHDVEESQQETLSERGKTDESLFDKSAKLRNYDSISFD